MSDKIIELKGKKNEPEMGAYVWTCPCGSELFLLHQCGDVECAECNRISNNMICGLKNEE